MPDLISATAPEGQGEQDDEVEEEDGFVKVREDSVSSCGSLELLASKLERQPSNDDDIIRESRDHDMK